MNITIFPKVTAGATLTLAVTFLYAAHTSVAAKTMKAAAVSPVSQGKALVSQYRCNGCHAADLNGKKGFSPSLHRSGVLKEYNQKTFVRVLLTGVTNDGGHVMPPMPVYGKGMMPPPPPGGPRPGGMHMRPGGPPPPGGMKMPPPMTTAQAAAIYTYLHTLK